MKAWAAKVIYNYVVADTDKARKHGLDEFVQASPSKFDHHDLFNLLQRLTLEFRLADQYTSLVCPAHHYHCDGGRSGREVKALR